MGFHNGAWATAWQVKSISDNVTQVRLTISQKSRQTGEYEQTFSGFVRFVGGANAQAALRLKEKDRIKLGDTDVTTNYVKEKNTTYTNYVCFNFERADGASSSGQQRPSVDSGNPMTDPEGFLNIPDDAKDEITPW